MHFGGRGTWYTPKEGSTGSWLSVGTYAGLWAELSWSFCNLETWCRAKITVAMPFLSLCQITILRRDKKASQLSMFCDMVSEAQSPSVHESEEPHEETQGVNAGIFPFMQNRLESLQQTIASILWVNGVWRRKGAVKGANLSLKWTFYRNPIFSGAQSQTDLVD